MQEENRDPHYPNATEPMILDAKGRVAETASGHQQLAEILRGAVDTLCGTAGMVALWDKDGACFVDVASHGLDNATRQCLRPLLGKAIPDLAASERSFDRLTCLAPEVRVPATVTAQVPDAVIALPLRVAGQTLGFICVFRPYPAESFGDDDQRLLFAFAGQLAAFMHSAELASKLAEERLRVESILEASADGIMTLDSGRRIVGFNACMARLTGWKKEEAVGRCCFDVLDLRSSEGAPLCPVNCPIDRGLEGPYHLNGIISAKNGQEVDVGISYALAHSETDNLPIAVINVRDMSHLRQVENLRSALLAAVSHELQTPISIIKAYASTLARTDAKWSPETIMDKLRTIEEESDRLSEMVNKLLRTSRLESGGFPLNKLLVDLPNEARKVAKRFADLTGLHKVEIDFPPGFPAILADPERIDEVLINLVDNAIKFSPRGGTVTICGETSGDKVLVTVADEGIGIAARDQSLVFDRFYRVEDASSKQTPGTGLGLYICRIIIEAHGGQVWVESELGSGSRFTFALATGEEP